MSNMTREINIFYGIGTIQNSTLCRIRSQNTILLTVALHTALYIKKGALSLCRAVSSDGLAHGLDTKFWMDKNVYIYVHGV